MSIYKQPGSDIFWMRFTLPGHRRIRESTGQTDSQEAERAEIKRKAEILNEPAALKGKTWQGAINKWMVNKDPSLTELQGIDKFNRFFPDRLLMDVSSDSVEAALSRFGKNPATFNRHRARVHGILALSKVVLDVPIRKIKEKERDWLTHEQWDKLRAELPPHMLAMATFAVTTGLRQANVLGLQWDHVDLAREIAWVDASEAKAKKAIVVPLSIEAINVLKTVQGQHPEFCFTYLGHPVSEIKTAFIAACIRAGVGRYVGGKPTKTGKGRPVGGRYRGFTWHGLRHTWATWHVQNGTPLSVLQVLGGWASYSMVLRYAKHSAGYLAQFANNSSKDKT